MRSSNIVASASALLILATSFSTTIVSAQVPTVGEPVAPGPACLACVKKSALAQDASCDAATMSTFGFIGPDGLDKMTPRQLRCNCVLSLYDEWRESCIYQDTCSQENSAYMRGYFENVRGDTKHCMPVFAPDVEEIYKNETKTTTTTPSATAAVLGAVAPTTTPTTPTGHNGGLHLSSSCSKFLVGAALAIGSTILLF